MFGAWENKRVAAFLGQRRSLNIVIGYICFSRLDMLNRNINNNQFERKLFIQMLEILLYVLFEFEKLTT